MLIYVFAFGLGSLAVAGGLSLALVGATQSALVTPKSASSARPAVSVVGAAASADGEEGPQPTRRAIKPSSRRGTDAPPPAAKDQDEE